MSDQMSVNKGKEPQIGALLEFKSGNTWGQGIYIGDDEMVYMSGPVKKDVFEHTRIYKQRVSSAQKRGTVKEVDPGTNMTSSPEQIRERALERVGEMAFNIQTGGCEKFTTWCRQGGHLSFQEFACK